MINMISSLLRKRLVIMMLALVEILTFSTGAYALPVTSNLQDGKSAVISGVVKDEEGEPLPGVTIRINPAKSITMTDIDGKFSVKYEKAKNVSITFISIGMKDETIILINNGEELIKGNTNLAVKMKYDNEVISEVVVTGYGNISKKSFTGTATSVSRQEILKAAPKSAIGALQIFDPSLRIPDNISLGSNPNAIPDMTVRGQSGVGVPDLDKLSTTSLNNNPNLPTFILDGFEVSVTKIYDLDVNRIESMTLLKDAAATAMYGSRAANGVLIITTVAPKAGKINVSYSLDMGIATPDLSYYNLMDANQKLLTERIAGLYDSPDPARKLELEKLYNKKLQNIERGVNTDWKSLPLRTGFNHKHSLFVEGGEKSLRYGLELMYDKDNGVMKGSFREKIGAGLSLSYNYKSLNIRNYVSFDNINGVESPYGIYSDFTKMNPYDTYLDDYGKISKNMINWGSGNERNPMYDSTLSSYDKTNYKQFKDNLEIKWDITKDFSIKGSASLFYDLEKGEKFRDPEATYFESLADKGDLRISDRTNWGYDASVLAHYNGHLGKNYLNISAGFNARQTTAKSTYSHYVGFPEGGFSSPEFAEELKYKPTTETEANRLFGALLMANYSYDNIYLVDISGRLDGSSQFGSKKKYAPFASGGVGINIHNYSFVKNNLKWLDQFKIRSSFGQTGKVNFPSYTAQDKFFFITDNWFTTGTAATLNYMGNPNLKWETTNTFEVGGEISIFNNALYVKLTRYWKRTKDLIADMTIQSSSGFTVYKENIGEVKNNGWEFNIRTKILDTKRTQMYLFANLSNNSNELVKISNAMQAYNERVNEFFDKDAFANKSPVLRYVEGHSMNAIYGMQSLGIDPATGKELFQYKDGSIGTQWIGGENVVVGDTEPTISGSFGANLNYKGFTIDAYFRYDYGGQIYNMTLLDKVERADPNFNCDTRVITDRWQNVGDVAQFKSIKDWKEPTQPTSRFVQDYNWLKLNSLSIGYEMPRKLIEKIKLSRLKFQLNCTDLFTISSIKMEKGTSYPFARGYNLSISATF